MKFEYIKYAFDNILHRKLRSWLTVLSILIGIASIYALMSFGQGLSVYVNSLASDIGTDKLIIQAKGGSAPGTDDNFYIKQSEIDFISKVNGIDEAVGYYIKSAEVEFNNQKKYVFVGGVPMGEGKGLVEELFVMDIVKGRELKKGDKLKATLGHNYQLQDKIFSKSVKLGDKLIINGKEVKVIGFYDSVGNPQDDSNIYVTNDAIEILFPETISKFQMGLARVSKNYVPSDIAEKAQDKLRKFKGQKIGQEDFFIQTFEQAIETFSNILTIINAILLLIALISLVVAAVNIMNTMYTAVLERTKEIGIMKAVGAKNKDIMVLFLVESGFLGLIGGLLGIILGYLISRLGGTIAANAGFSLLKPVFPVWLFIGCLLFAFLVGTFSGYLPSKQASRLKPVDALRYE